MWSRQNPLFILCIVLRYSTDAADLIHVAGYQGREVKVFCPYENGYESYQKYLCKGSCGSDDVLVETGGAKRDRYSIYDNKEKKIFTVTISGLRLTDAGKYWCGVTRTFKDLYTEVKLKIVIDRCCDNITTVQGYVDDSMSISCPYHSKYQHNLKYFCRGSQPSTCLQQAVITSDHNQNGRFNLHDDKASSNFSVTIASLTQEDSGLYLCGIRNNNSLDIFSVTELEVKVWCCVKSNNMTGNEGHPVTMQCPYPPQHRNNVKFLCKGDRRYSCDNIVTSQARAGKKTHTDSRFTLQDDVRSSFFLVTITELRAEDSGTFWCGSDRVWSVGDYTKIQLSVVSPQLTSISPTGTPTVSVEPVSSQTTHISGTPIKNPAHISSVVFIVPVTVAVVLIVALALVMVYRWKCYKVQGAGVNMNRNTRKTDEIYENHEVVACTKLGSSKQQSTLHQYDDAEDQQESDYQNLAAVEEIYCNQIVINCIKN
ncbi:polymeric immunoglobulin receptor-like isoform X1 [Centroberyx affinis]|uniref:polymeric immunoglobulin receptor-like isoform X1 n=1 Tax=Centroberyx affinis TaxID=166261 RepID=UPI003A5BCD78